MLFSFWPNLDDNLPIAACSNNNAINEDQNHYICNDVYDELYKHNFSFSFKFTIIG